MRFNISLFTLFTVLLMSCSQFDKIQRSDNLDEKLDAAYAYYDKAEYHKASLLFEDLVPLLKGRSESETALLYQAKCHFNQKQYIMSAYYLKDFIDTYPRSEHIEEVRFLYAKSLFNDSPDYNLDQTNSTSALKAIQTFANRHPDSEHMEEINSMADALNAKLEHKAYENAKIFYNLGGYNNINYKSAIVSFDSFLESYPDSEFSEEITYLKIDAQYNLAKSSVVNKQKERYHSAIEYYQDFIDKYPESKYRKAAETIYESCISRLEKDNL
ncbi:outer membrane protein assembly factor BamD [Cytophagaceae bacterium ABcell3]|nr:outer membrane protein assembly factor BamD [Cytophagaceae bacterium ABcell3]